MNLKDILVAKVVGGVFHIEDAAFQANIGPYVDKLNTILKNAQKAGKIKNDYYVSLVNNEKSTITDRAMLSIQGINDKSLQIQMSDKAIVFEVGTPMKQNVLFHKREKIRELARLIDEIVKLRKHLKLTDFGVFPKFVIPYNSNVAPNNLRNVLLSNFNDVIGLPRVDKIKNFKFSTNTNHGNLAIESQFDTSEDKTCILALFDIRANKNSNFKQYDSFLLKSKTLYESVCKGIIQKFIDLDDINEAMLTKNKS